MTDEGGHEAGRLRSILDASDDAIVTTDLDGRVIDWNERAVDLFGWVAEDVRGRTVGSFLVPDYARDMFFSGLDQFRATGHSSQLEKHFETTAKCDDGREIPIEASTSVIVLEGTTICAMFLRDLSERRTADQRSVRRLLETRLIHAATTSASDVESVVETAIEAASQVKSRVGGLAYEIRGNRLEPLVSWFAPDFEQGEELATRHDELRLRRTSGLLGEAIRRTRSISAGTAGDENIDQMWDWKQTGIRRFDAVPVMVEGRAEFVLLLLSRSDGEPSRECSVLTRNVATQVARFVERQRRDEERARLAAIVDGSYDAIIGKSLDGRILSWNEGARRVYGYTSEEAVGKSVTLLLPDGVATEEPKIIEATRSGRRLTEYEAWRRHASGRDILVAITVSPIKDSRGRVIGSSTIERDVTRRREREIQLREAVEAAERANRTKSEFLANISHELRTPMNAIIGMLDLSLGENLDDLLQDYLATARDSANTLLYLLNDLLDFSRMEAGRFELDDEPFRFRDTIESVVKTLSLRAYEKGLEIACRVDAGVPNELRGDGRRLRQIIMNLVANAVKFTEQGEIVVDAEVESRNDEEVVIRVSVRDTGIGIAEDDLDRIFNAFAQADASSTRHYQGTGLGLAIVQELVRKMDGLIQVSSTLGSGSAFTFTARFAVLAERSLPLVSEAAVEELRNLPVLVVDDNATNRTIIAEMLTNWNMRPVVTESAAEAVEELRLARERNEPFQLVVVDALMPETDGFDLVRQIRSEQLTNRGPVLMLSSADRQTFREQAEEVEVDAFLEKPVSQSAMLDIIMQTLRGPQLDRGVVRSIRPSGRPLKILVAEDTPANQKVVRSILVKRGHDVTLAHNGREALDLHESREFDAILMDVQMPTMDGLQATRAIRGLVDPEKSGIPVIAMTAHAMQGDRERCLSAGMDGYLSKPIDARHLVELLEEFGERRSGSTDSSTPQRRALPDDASTDELSDTADITAPTEPPNPPAMTDLPFNREIALTRLGGDEELLADMYEYYREDAVKLLETLRTAISDEQIDEARRAAHSLKGLSANIEANVARDIAEELEHALADGQFQVGRDRIDDLVREVERVIAAFDGA